MVSGLHCPDIIPVIGEGFFGIGFNTDICKHRIAIHIQDETAGIIVIVVVCIVACLSGQNKTG